MNAKQEIKVAKGNPLNLTGNSKNQGKSDSRTVTGEGSQQSSYPSSHQFPFLQERIKSKELKKKKKKSNNA